MSSWVGSDYDRISRPHAEMGAAALDRLELQGDERVLDVGCGSGRLTERLLEHFPRDRAVALDGIASMLAEAGGACSASEIGSRTSRRTWVHRHCRSRAR